ncbi:MAG TPA: FAD-binding oxidoreductase [Actinopolymorphaceae bacterium]|nr:FAD-binding oxidoreductase [Actinopolymorphaceae bacterium]
MTPHTADIAIVGGGIIGLSAAYELAQATSARIVVFEKATPASGTTGGSAGVICLCDFHDIYAAYTLLGDARVRDLGRTYDIGFHPWGSLGVYYEGGQWPPPIDPFAAHFGPDRPDSLYHREILDRDELVRRFPWIKPEGVVGGAFYPNHGFVNPYKLVDLYERLAVGTGRVEVRRGTPVLQLRRNGDRVATVVTRRGAWSVGDVVNAGGPWGAKVAALAERPLALTPQRIQVCVATAFDDGIDSCPLTGVPEQVNGEGVWCRGEEGGTMLFGQHHHMTKPGYTVDPDSANRVNDDSYPADVATVYRRYWRLPKAEFLNGWCCVYGTTEDGFPIVSRDAEVANLWHAVGMNGHGITIHAGVARSLRALMVDGSSEIDLTDVLGRPERLDIAPLSAARFDSGELIRFHDRTTPLERDPALPA